MRKKKKDPQGQLVGTGRTELSKREQKQQNKWVQRNWHIPEAPKFHAEQKLRLENLKQGLSGIRKTIRGTRRTKVAKAFDKIVGRNRSYGQFHDPKKLTLAGGPSGKSLVGVHIGKRLYQKTDTGYIKKKFNKKGIVTKIKKISARRYGRAVGAVELGKRGTAGGVGTIRTIGKNPKIIGSIVRNTNVKPDLSIKKWQKKEIKKIKKMGIR